MIMNQPVFKFLEAYTRDDQDQFFGREAEEGSLHELSFNTNLMLIYGASGTGKTRLVQCGLARQFGKTRWKELYVRRGNNIMDSLREKVQAEIQKYKYEGLEPRKDTAEAVIQLQNLIFTPVYLIFDQFEELFILPGKGGNAEERKAFFQFVKEVTRPGGSGSCHVILVMREEFIAYLWEFEKEIPELFDFRYRVERMRKDNVKEVIGKMLKSVKVIADEAAVDQIVEALKLDENGIELTHLQVYLDRLYKKARESQSGGEIIIEEPMIQALGEIKAVIGNFLDEELAKLNKKFSKNRQHLPLRLLGSMVSDEKTKRVMTEDQLDKVREELGMTADEYKLCMDAFSEMRIIRTYL